ncbi:MAG TPA: acyl-CoA dehydrogenase [Mycobacteriales bacterium]|nr:acyl-CoA dehydrogenase [Mycobacteriales bacterium]
MPIAISDDHRILGETAAEFLKDRDARGAARALLETPVEPTPHFWADLAALGWLGLHVPEEYGGAGYGLEELVVVVEELGRAMTPGAFVPSVIASAVVAACGDAVTKAFLLPGLADGSRTAAVTTDATIEIRDGKAFGTTGVVLGGGMGDLVLAPAREDVVVVETAGDGVTVTIPDNLDPTRRCARISLDGAAATVLPGAQHTLVDLARLILAAEAVGLARECTERAAEYAKVREQFGRPIAMFQAVKHHCANMLVATELATAAVWDAARASVTGGDQLTYTAAIAASIAGPAAYLCSNLNIQVHGGIGFTWEHDAHVYLRRATVLFGLLDPDHAAIATVNLTRGGVRRERNLDLPPEAEEFRPEVRAFAETIRDQDKTAQRAAMIASGYAVPHWPTPWGRAAGALEQLVVEQEFAAAGLARPQYGITAWVILTLIQHGTEEQVARWVPSALSQDVIWCQLFSEPGAGSDAAGITTKAVRAEGGWLITGQKVWTSGAQIAGNGLATVRTNPEAAKHAGITTVVIDMHAPGVEVRPLRQTTGDAEFNEVFFNDVFVPDEDVVGDVDGGWTVARATLGNESVSIGGGSAMSFPGDALIAPYDAHPERLCGGAARIGHYIADQQAIGLLNLRSAARAVAGGGPGPEGNVTKLVLSELSHESAAILAELSGPDIAFLDAGSGLAGRMVLLNRALSIAGGTSEIKRNQIGERILGLPRDPLIK